MSVEVVTQIDFNYSNTSGAAQTASVTCVLDPETFTGAPAASTFLTPNTAFEKAIAFGDPDLTDAFEHFRVTEVTESQNSISKSKTYKAQDELSLILQSKAVLLRGRDVGPQGEFNFDTGMPNWTEVPNEIKYDNAVQSYVDQASGQAPEVKGNILILGQIYNELTLKDIKGEDYTKVYLKGVEKTKLQKPPINNVYQYEYSGWGQGLFDDKGSWQDSTVRLGYTLKELKEGLDALGINHEGIPDDEDYLIDVSGRVIDVIQAAAQQIGYFWYIDLVKNNLPKIKFIDSNAIDVLVPTNYIDTTDERIISSSYTESTLKPAKALIYSANLEIKKPEYSERTQKERKLKKPFKRVNLSSKLRSVLNFLMKNYFLLWQTGSFDEDYFRKIWYYGMHTSNNFGLAIKDIGYDDELSAENIQVVLDTAVADYEAMRASENRDLADAANWRIIEKYELAKYFREPKQREKNGDFIFEVIYSMLKKVADVSDKKKSKPKSVTDPTSLYTYALIELFLETSFGGIYISTPMSKYRAERVSFDPDSKYSILGIFPHDEKLEDIPALKPLGDFLNTFTDGSTVTVGNLVKKFFTTRTVVNRYFAIAFESIPEKFKKTDNTLVDSVLSDDNIRILESAQNIEYLAINDTGVLNSFLNTSRDQYDAAKASIVDDDYITIPYTRSRNPLSEESDREDDDEHIPTSTNFDDLDTNTDLKFWDVYVPKESGNSNDLDSNYRPITIENYSARTKDEVSALVASKKDGLATNKRISSTRTIDGVVIPTFDPLLSSVTINYSPEGATTTITESNIDIMPADQSLIIDRDRRAKAITSTFTNVNATRKNLLGL